MLLLTLRSTARACGRFPRVPCTSLEVVLQRTFTRSTATDIMRQEPQKGVLTGGLKKTGEAKKVLVKAKIPDLAGVCEEERGGSAWNGTAAARLGKA